MIGRENLVDDVRENAHVLAPGVDALTAIASRITTGIATLVPEPCDDISLGQFPQAHIDVWPACGIPRRCFSSHSKLAPAG